DLTPAARQPGHKRRAPRDRELGHRDDGNRFARELEARRTRLWPRWVDHVHGTRCDPHRWHRHDGADHVYSPSAGDQMSTLERHRVRALAALVAVMAGQACTEPVQSRAPKTQVDGALVARLEPSVAVARVGDIVQVALTVQGTGAKDVASFTARIAYDSTRLR